MTILSWIKSLFGPLETINHIRFGDCIAVSWLGSNLYYWETSNEINLGEFSVLVVFDADRTGPTEAQVQAWDIISGDFEKFYRNSKALMAPIIERNGLEVVLSDFRPTLVELPGPDDHSQSWEMVLDHQKGESDFLVKFQGFEAVTAEIH